MGRKATPTKLKELAGNPGKRKLNRNEPIPIGRPCRPPIMTPVAKLIWDRLVQSMPPGVYSNADTNLLAAYSEACANHQQATSALAENPDLISEGSTGQKVINPIFKHQADQARLIVQRGARLGLDPIARQSLNSESEPSSANDEGFDIK